MEIKIIYKDLQRIQHILTSVQVLNEIGLENKPDKPEKFLSSTVELIRGSKGMLQIIQNNIALELEKQKREE